MRISFLKMTGLNYHITKPMLCTLLLGCFLTTSTFAQGAVDDGQGVSTQANSSEIVTTMAPGYSDTFYLHVNHVESKTSSIQIAWNVPSNFKVNNYIVSSQKKESEALTRSSVINPPDKQYIVEDLMTNEVYNICVVANVVNNTEIIDVTICQDFNTIPRIRDDSLIVLFCVFAYILLMILIGYLCWRYAKKQKEADQDDEEKIDPVNNRNQYQ